MFKPRSAKNDPSVNIMGARRPRAFPAAGLLLGFLPMLACAPGATTGPGGSGGMGGPGGLGANSGGANGSGGGVGSGGTPSSGGANGSGGAPSSGGAPGSGGVNGSGGGSSTGGGPGTGGATASGGAAGGSSGAGGRAAGGRGGAATGGAGGRATGGSTGTGGAPGSGGAVGSGGAGGTSCTTPPPASPLLGWASLDGMGQNGTTGGGNATPVVVTTAANFISNAAGATARVIHVMGNLTGSFPIGSNKTVIGLCGASLKGHIGLSGAVNVIVRNLTIIGNNCSEDPSDCSAGADAVTIGDGSHHVWFDHTTVYDGSDGNLDITSGADFVTISWTKFYYSTARTDVAQGDSGHRFSNLIGSADMVPEDAGHLNVTWHHNWWAQNIRQRMPRSRRGQIHVFNNLYTSAGNDYCTNAGYQARLLVQNNVYMGVNNPLSPDANGDMRAEGNLFQSVTGTQAASGTGFTPTYAFTLDATASLAATIMSQVGPR